MSTSTSQPPDRIALDAAAVVQSLSRCAAEFQAKAAAQKALVAAASQRSLGDLAADAALMAEVYEDAAARLFSTITGILTGRGGVEGVAAEAGVVESKVAQAAAASPLLSYCDAVSPQAAAATRRMLDDKRSATERYQALVGFVSELTRGPVARQLPSDVHAALAALYAAITDKLPDLGEVAKALTKIEDDWRKSESTSTGASTATATPDASLVRRGDWFKKMRGHVAALQGLRLQIERLDVAATELPGLLDSYERLVDVVIANMGSQPWPGGVVQSLAEATTKELRRLRQDCGVVAAMSRLK